MAFAALIDHDTLAIQCKGDLETLRDYAFLNSIEQAVSIVLEEEDFTDRFTLQEMQSFYCTYETEVKRTFRDEEEAAEICFGMLQNKLKKVPKYTEKLGERLIEEDASQRRKSNKASKTEKVFTRTRKPRMTNVGKVKAGNKPKETTALFPLWKIAKEEKQWTKQELIDALTLEDFTESKAKKYVSRALRKGVLEPNDN